MVAANNEISSVFLEKMVKASPLSWQSKKIRRIVRSTLTGGALLMSDAVYAAVFLTGLYSELMFNVMSPGLLLIVYITDSLFTSGCFEVN